MKPTRPRRGRPPPSNRPAPVNGNHPVRTSRRRRGPGARRMSRPGRVGATAGPVGRPRGTGGSAIRHIGPRGNPRRQGDARRRLAVGGSGRNPRGREAVPGGPAGIARGVTEVAGAGARHSHIASGPDGSTLGPFAGTVSARLRLCRTRSLAGPGFRRRAVAGFPFRYFSPGSEKRPGQTTFSPRRAAGPRSVRSPTRSGASRPADVTACSRRLSRPACRRSCPVCCWRSVRAPPRRPRGR
jgi:hypothetical protein